MIFQIRQTIDIKKDNPVLEYKQGLDYGNNLAHEWLVFVEEDGALVDLASVAVTGYFLREDGVTVKVDGSVKNGACSVVFDRRCYLIEGAVKCAMVLTRGAEVVTSAKLRTNANQNITDKIIDTGDTIPSDVYDLLAQIDAMREATTATVAATAAANTAATRANAGAKRVEQLQIDASGLAGDSNKLGGKAPEYYLQPPSLLDNGELLIAQAGFMGMHGSNAYLADRWMAEKPSYTSYDENTKTITFTAASSPITVSQKVSHNVAGKTLTLAIKASNVTGNVHLSERYVQDGHKDFSIVEGINCYSVTGGEGMQVLFWSQGGGSMRIEWIALYEGTYTADTLPPYVPRGYAAELAECQRYYYQVLDSNIIVAISFDGSGFGDICYPLPHEMRTVPTVKCFAYISDVKQGDNTSRLFLDGSYNTVNCSYQWKSTRFISPRFQDSTYKNKVGFVSFRFTASADL